MMLGGHNKVQEEALKAYFDNAAQSLEHRIGRNMMNPKQHTSPFKSILAYDVDDQDIFFGRDTDSQELVHAILNNRLTVIHAPSGAGKTSLLRAGLSKLLILQGFIPIYPRSMYVTLYQDITAALRGTLVPPSSAIFEPDAVLELSFSEYLGYFCKHLDRQTKGLILVFDQFEEILSPSLAAEEVNQLIEQLSYCYHDTNLPVFLVFAIRSEKFSYLAPYKKYLPTIITDEYFLSPMNQTELRNTIIEPLERVSDGITFGDRLVAQIINDLEQSSLTLPHMQLICSELFRLGKEEDRTLNINDYQILGGVKGVLSNYLMRTLSGMSYKKQAQAREFLTHLVSEHGRRLSTSISQVIEASHYNQSDIEDTVHKLREARLIIKYEENGQFLYQLSHDSLTVEIEKWIERIEYVLPTRKNVQMLCAGLTHVFNYQDLLRLIRYEFGIILSHIIPVAGNTYSKIVSDLVYYFALKQEGLNKLLKAAHNSNPDNPLLIHAKQDLEGTHFAALPSLETAILASFRDIIDLQHTIFCYLDINIAEEINLKKRTFKQIIEDVVQFFSASESGLDWLVAALRNSNPKNQLLSAVEEAYRMIGRITIPVKELWLSPLSQIRRLICQKLPMAEIDSIVRDNLDIEIHNLIVGASKLNLVAALLIQIRDESNKLLHLVESLAKAIPDLAELMPLYKQYRSFTSPLTDTNELSVEGKAVAYAISQSLNIEMLQRIVRWEFDRALFEIVPPVGVTFEEQVLYLVEAYSSSIEDLEHFVERVLNSEQINAPNNALLAKIFANLRAGPTVISSILASANLKSE